MYLNSTPQKSKSLMDGRGKGVETSDLEEPTMGGSSGGAPDAPIGDAQGASATPDFAAFMQLFQGFVHTMRRNQGSSETDKEEGERAAKALSDEGPGRAASPRAARRRPNGGLQRPWAAGQTMGTRCSTTDATDSHSPASADAAPHRHYRRGTATANAAPQVLSPTHPHLGPLPPCANTPTPAPSLPTQPHLVHLPPSLHTSPLRQHPHPGLLPPFATPPLPFCAPLLSPTPPPSSTRSTASVHRLGSGDIGNVYLAEIKCCSSLPAADQVLLLPPVSRLMVEGWSGCCVGEGERFSIRGSWGALVCGVRVGRVPAPCVSICWFVCVGGGGRLDLLGCERGRGKKKRKDGDSKVVVVKEKESGVDLMFQQRSTLEENKSSGCNGVDPMVLHGSTLHSYILVLGNGVDLMFQLRLTSEENKSLGCNGVDPMVLHGSTEVDLRRKYGVMGLTPWFFMGRPCIH
ncbi:hypothetical protein Taro_044266, partial [Colocasia esculenta]|nr:hypothetical protein [Colocasia esculenta]